MRKALASSLAAIALLAGGGDLHAQFTFGPSTPLSSPVNLPEFYDMTPAISPDGLSLFFGTNRPLGVFADIWVATRDTTSDDFGGAVSLGPAVNSSAFEAWPSISADGLSLYFTDSNAFGFPLRPGSANGDLWKTTRPDASSDWETPVNLGQTVNSSASDGAPNLSADGLSLFFESNRAGGSGDVDLWMATRPSADADWGSPVNLGPTVNSLYYDSSPAISPDGLGLFFTSARPGGSGEYDLWVTTRPSSDGDWGEPVNLGPEINGWYADAMPSLSAEFPTVGTTLYYASFSDAEFDGPSDIFQVRVFPELPVLTWDALGDGDWGDIDAGTGNSRWLKSGNPVADLPDDSIDAVVPANTVTVVEDHLVRSLTVDGGAIAISAGRSLTVGEQVSFAAGTTLSMGAGATLNTGGGVIDSLASGGDATIEVTFGDLRVGAYDDGGQSGIFTKRGSESLSLHSVTASATTFSIEEGVLRSQGEDPVTGAVGVTLAGGTLVIEGAEILTANSLAGLFYDVPTGQPDTIEPIDAGSGVLTGPPNWTRPLAQPLDFPDNTLQDYAGVPEDDYAAVWRGKITVGGPNLPAGEITFGLRSDDGNVLYIDLNGDGDLQDPGELVAADNSNHGFQDVVRTVNLDAGTYHFAAAFYERGGGDGLTVKFGEGTQSNYDDAGMKVIDPTAPGQAGIWSEVAWDAIDATALVWSVTEDSTLILHSDQTAMVSAPTMINGTLTTAGARAGIAMPGVNIDSSATAVGFDPQVDTDYGMIDAHGAAVTICKAGSSTWTLAATPINIANATWQVEQGTFRLADLGLLGGRPVRLAGGTLAVEAQQSPASAVDVTLAADSSLDSTAGSAMSFGSLDLRDGVLTVTGAAAGVAFAGATVDPSATSVGFNLLAATDLGPIEANSAAATIVKLGPADLILDKNNTGLDRATFGVQEGRLIAASESNALGEAALLLDGGELVLTGNITGGSVAYDNAVAVESGSILTAGAAGVGAAGPVDVTLGSVDKAIALNGGVLTLRTTDGYSLTFGGEVSGNGGLRLDEGEVTLAATDNRIRSLRVNGGTLTADGDLTVDTMTVAGGTVGTGSDGIVVSDTLRFNQITYGIADATFTLRSGDLAAGAEVTLRGGTMTIGEGASIDGFGQGADFTTNATATAVAAGVPNFDVPDVLQLTTNNDNQAVSAFYNVPQDVTFFTAEFDYQPLPSGTPADGFAFVLQSDAGGPGALGGDGGGMGYSGIGNSVALILNVYNGHTIGILLADGGNWDNGAYQSTDDVDIIGGNVIHSTLDYDGSTLSLDMEDLSTGDTYQTTFDVDIANLVGDDTALVGFTGATGGSNCDQRISNFVYSYPVATTEDPSVNLTVTAETTVDLTSRGDAVFGNLTLADGVTLSVSRAALSVNDVTAGDGASFNGEALLIRGSLSADDGAGMLNVAGELEFGDTAEYRCELAAAANDLLSVVGDAYLGGTLTLSAVDAVGDPGNHTRTIISTAGGEGAVLGDFAQGPAAGDHLGHGVYFQDLSLAPDETAMAVTVLQAAAGDTNGDRQVNNTDLQLILGANSFGAGPGFAWTEGDFDGDTDVDNTDLQLILGTGLFGTGFYAAAAAQRVLGSGAHAVPEPGSLLMAGICVGLALLRRRVAHARSCSRS